MHHRTVPPQGSPKAPAAPATPATAPGKRPRNHCMMVWKILLSRASGAFGRLVRGQAPGWGQQSQQFSREVLKGHDGSSWNSALTITNFPALTTQCDKGSGHKSLGRPWHPRPCNQKPNRPPHPPPPRPATAQKTCSFADFLARRA